MPTSRSFSVMLTIVAALTALAAAAKRPRPAARNRDRMVMHPDVVTIDNLDNLRPEHAEGSDDEPFVGDPYSDPDPPGVVDPYDPYDPATNPDHYLNHPGAYDDAAYRHHDTQEF